MKKLLLLVSVGIMSAAAQTAGPGISAVYWASKSGAKLDCNLSTGAQIGTGGTCTNNDAILNGILASATATNPVTLIVDGPTVTTGIVGPSTGYWTIDCLNPQNGFYMAPGSNAHTIRNIPNQNGYTFQSTTPPYVIGGNWSGPPGTPGHDIQIRNCYLNGNRGNGTNGNSNSGNPRQAANGNWLFGIYLDNMQEVKIDNVWLYNQPSFNTILNACVDCEVSGLRADDSENQLGENGDGIHVDGPSSQIRIIDPWFNVNDDSVALNASEGYGGTIRDVSVTGSHCAVCFSALRTASNEGDSTADAMIQNVTFTNGSGSLVDSATSPCAAFFFGVNPSPNGTLDLVQNMKISNSIYTLNSVDCTPVQAWDNVGELSMSNVTWLSPDSSGPWLNMGATPVTVSSFTCTACKIIRNSAVSPYWAKVPSGDTIKRLELNGVSIENGGSGSYSAVPYALDVQSGGAITSLVLTAADPTYMPTLTNGNEWSRITNFYGSGVSNYYRNTPYASLPPASYEGLSASINDSGTQVWGATAGTALVLASAATASAGSTVYTGTITGGTSNALAGVTFTVAGFDMAANNGTFICTASTVTTLTLSNAVGVSDTHAATATYGGGASYAQLTSDGTNWTVTGK